MTKFPNFTITYIHNPHECKRCFELGYLSDDFSSDELDVTPQDKLVNIESVKDPPLFLSSTPIQNSLIDETKESGLQKELNTGFVFKKPYSARQFKRVKVLKKKRYRSISSSKAHLLPVIQSKKRNKSEPAKKSPKSEKKSTVDEIKKSSEKKLKPKSVSDGDKPPGKGTLKRKRWFFDKLNNSNENYEDDIFENEKFGHFQDLFEDDTDNIEKYEHLQTPVFPFSISPREESPSPTYRDCYSPTELTESRKGAEEYRFRRGKMMKGLYPPKKDIQKPKPENKPDVQKTLEAVVKILNETKNMLDKSESDSDEDSYFPDLFNPSTSQTCN